MSSSAEADKDEEDEDDEDDEDEEDEEEEDALGPFASARFTAIRCERSFESCNKRRLAPADKDSPIFNSDAKACTQNSAEACFNK